MMRQLSPILAACLLLAGLQAQSKSDLTVAKIMADPKWIGVSPSGISWAEDGQAVYFRWNPNAEEDDSQYKYDLAKGEIVKVSEEEELWLPSFGGDYSADRRWKTYAKWGDIILLDIDSGKLSHITTTAARESSPRFSGAGNDIIYQQGDNLYLWQRETGQTRQLVDIKKGEAPEDKKPKGFKKWLADEERSLIGILDERLTRQDKQKQEREDNPPNLPTIYLGKSRAQNVQISPDLRYVTFVKVDDPGDRARTKVPNYVTESGYSDMLNARPFAGSPRAKYKLGILDIAADKVTYLKLDDVPAIDAFREFTGAKQAEKRSDRRKGKADKNREVRFQGPVWSDDGKSAIVQLLSQDFKDRWIMRIDLPSGKLTVLLQEYDEAWLGSTGGRFGGRTWGWLKDNRTVWYLSEGTGYAHLYTVGSNGKGRKQLTKGKHEIYGPRLTPDGASFIFTANVDYPGIRHAYRLPVGGGTMEQLTSMPGRVNISLSPDGKQLALRHSLSNRPWELYLQAATPGAEPMRITESQSEAFKAYRWREPQFVMFPARDKANVYARLYTPEPGKANGAGVVFVHGAGYLHNAHQWWSTYFREYMFNNMLTDMGYTVIDIDYRASAGYGRDWRTAIYRFMGGKDLDDNVDGAAYLVKEHGIDPQRIGMYGGSYGGFIALMAMFTEPGVFAAAAGLRSVTDWAHYNDGYTSRILNIPVADSVAYRRSSPIYHAEGLEGSLLMLHGMVDTNVHFQDVVRLSQRLIELGKTDWELAVFPMEGHGFREPSSWTDEYRRILKLFEDNLQ